MNRPKEFLKVEYIAPEDDQELKDLITRVNEDWDPIFWLIEVLAGPEYVTHTDQSPGVIHKFTRLNVMGNYFALVPKEEWAETLLKKVFEHCHKIMPEDSWVARAYEMENGCNDWDLKTCGGVRKVEEQ